MKKAEKQRLKRVGRALSRKLNYTEVELLNKPYLGKRFKPRAPLPVKNVQVVAPFNPLPSEERHQIQVQATRSPTTR